MSKIEGTVGAFDANVYRANNDDLVHLSDTELLAHFEACRGERRVYSHTETTAQFLSQRWLRGQGLEVGPGDQPLTLYGNASADYAELNAMVDVNGVSPKIVDSLDHEDFARNRRSTYDFAAACHVIEYCDSALMAIHNLLRVTRPGGVVYIVVADLAALPQRAWMARYGFSHHMEEYWAPRKYASLHERAHAEATGAGMHGGAVPMHLRATHLKHCLGFDGWLGFFHEAQQFLKGCRFVDVRYGHERKDCHFVLEVL